jgi:fumarate reductase subunit D
VRQAPPDLPDPEQGLQALQAPLVLVVLGLRDPLGLPDQQELLPLSQVLRDQQELQALLVMFLQYLGQLDQVAA